MDHLRHAIDITEAVAATNDQLVTPRMLLRATVSRWMIGRMVQIGHLRRVLHGIYLVGAARLTQRQLLRVAQMRSGVNGALTGISGLELRDVLYADSGWASAVTTTHSAVGRHVTLIPMESGAPGVIKIRRIDRPAPTSWVDGFRLTTVGRAISDLVRFGAPWLMKRAWNQAEFRGLLETDALRTDVGNGQRPGAAELDALLKSRRILTDADTDLRGKTELPWLHLMIEAGIPMPEVNAKVRTGRRTFDADYLWRKYGLALELDSPEHLEPVVIARDHERDALFDDVGIFTLRFIDSLALDDPAPYLERLKQTLARRGWRPTENADAQPGSLVSETQRRPTLEDAGRSVA